MHSLHLLHNIEAHADRLSEQIVRAVLQHPELKSYQRLDEPELRTRIANICHRLGDWIHRESAEAVAHELETIGRRRWKEGIPLSEVLLVLGITKDRLIRHAREEFLEGNVVELHGGEELEYRMMHFFDQAALALVRGYESERFGRVSDTSGAPSVDTGSRRPHAPRWLHRAKSAIFGDKQSSSQVR